MEKIKKVTFNNVVVVIPFEPIPQEFVTNRSLADMDRFRRRCLNIEEILLKSLRFQIKNVNLIAVFNSLNKNNL